MFFKIIIMTIAAGICVGESPQDEIPHIRTSGKAVSTQKFIREDVPLSYQYNAVHDYTTPHPPTKTEAHQTKELNTHTKYPVYSIFHNVQKSPEIKPLYTKVEGYTETSSQNTEVPSYGGFYQGSSGQKFQEAARNLPNKEFDFYQSTYNPIYMNEQQKSADHLQTLVIARPYQTTEPAKRSQKILYYAIIPKEYIAGPTNKYRINSMPAIAYQKDSIIPLYFKNYSEDHDSPVKSNPTPFMGTSTQSYYSHLASNKAALQETPSSQKTSHTLQFHTRPSAELYGS